MKHMRIDETRGVASVLVVAFHAVASEPALAGTTISYVTQSLVFVRMPLFIAITGFLYGRQRARRPLSFRGWGKRTARLTPPFLLATVMCCIIDVAAGRGFDPVHAILFGAWHLWYLQALVLILAVTCLLERFTRFRGRQLWIAVGVAFCLSATGAASGLVLLSFDDAARLLPFFLAGAAIGDTNGGSLAPSGRRAIYAAGATGFLLHQLALAKLYPAWSNSGPVAASIGLSSFVLVGSHIPANNHLRRIGAYSLPIFLWHLQVSAIFSAVTWHRIDAYPIAMVAAKITLGIVVPIIVCIGCGRFLPSMLLFVGRRSASKSFVPIEHEGTTGSGVPAGFIFRRRELKDRTLRKV